MVLLMMLEYGRWCSIYWVVITLSYKSNQKGFKVPVIFVLSMLYLKLNCNSLDKITSYAWDATSFNY